MTVISIDRRNADSTTLTINPIPDGKWVAEVTVSSFLEPYPEDLRIPVPQRPCIVPVQQWAQVLGVSRDKVEISLTRENSSKAEDCYGYVSRSQYYQLVSDEPFVVVYHCDGETNHHGWVHRRKHGFTAARQMHKGELGRHPELLRRPEIFQSDLDDPDSGHYEGPEWDQKWVRHKQNWVKLSEIAEIACHTADDIIRGYASFSDSTYEDPNMVFLRAPFREDDRIQVFVGDVPQNTRGFIAASLDSIAKSLDHSASQLWITQKLANRVIRLAQFGFGPSDESEVSFELRAPMPEAPKVDLPVLSPAELRELHELRKHLPEEISKERFRSAAERRLGTKEWQKAPQMSDELNGFAYYTDFESLEALDGQVVISTCFWTRGGSGSMKPNHYAGFLAVFPKRVEDPRRDESAILRIWFWPGELIRQTPSGSKGGLCPHQLLEPRIDNGVRYFLRDLGYSI